jgi:C-terminal processing protease CtpA/Prc
MMRTRIVFLSVSVTVIILFTGMIVASRETRDELFQALGNLAEVAHLIKAEYVDELNSEALALSLDSGIVESVDPWAAILPTDQVDAFNDFLKSPPPFGLVLSSRLGSAAVRATIPGSPAADADLQPWEVIERVDAIYTRGRPLWQIRLELMQHEQEGQPVMLTIVDRRVEDRREVGLLPALWKARTAMLDEFDDAQVVRVETLPEGAAEKIGGLINADKAVVLDLRNLVWGLEDEAIAVADLFVADGVLGGWRGRRAGSQTYEATAGAVVPEPPVILVNGDTEGVGEILAAALQRNGATVVGNRTVGHAPHMRLIQDQDVNLWLPVGRWLRADDTEIDGNGVEPDEVVDEADEDSDEDPALDRALEIAQQPLEKAA